MDLNLEEIKEKLDGILEAYAPFSGAWDENQEELEDYLDELRVVYQLLLDGYEGDLDGITESHMYEVRQYIRMAMGAIMAVVGVNAGAGSHSFSFDEFRFWKKARTHKEIGRHWFTQYGGGTNSKEIKVVDSSNVDLGVYYKFNEGILDQGEADRRDATVFDYSGRVSNGVIENY